MTASKKIALGWRGSEQGCSRNARQDRWADPVRMIDMKLVKVAKEPGDSTA
jgi:hypothetical protein